MNDINKENCILSLVCVFLILCLFGYNYVLAPKIGEPVYYNIDQNSVILDNSQENINNTQEYISIININTANVEELVTLKGIGESTANKIIEYRELNGDFLSIEDIKNVNGIAESKFETIKEFIIV